MATKFSLNPEPTFKAKVGIPVPGKGIARIDFEFNYFDRDEYVALFQQDPMPNDKGLIMQIVRGWGLDDEFNEDSVELLLKKYQKAAAAIMTTFCEEIGPSRMGN